MKTEQFLQLNETTFKLSTPFKASQIKDTLSPAIYNIKQDKDGNIFLVMDRAEFSLPTKIYGEQTQDVEFMMKTWEKRTQQSTGLFLSGRKGSGKSLISEQLGNRFLKKGYPVIYITEYIPANVLYTVFKNIPIACIIFEEFFKIYKENKHQELLNLFSDTEMKRRFFIVTDNHVTYEAAHIRGRPGRFFFSIHFSKIRKPVIQAICDEFAIHPFVKTFLEDWNDIDSEDGLNLDKLLLMAPLLPMATTLNDIYQCLRIYNIDPLPIIGWELESLEKKENKKNTSINLKQCQGNIEDDLVVITHDDVTLSVPIFDFKKTSQFKDQFGLYTYYFYEVDNYRIILKRSLVIMPTVNIDWDKNYNNHNLMSNHDMSDRGRRRFSQNFNYGSEEF